MSHSLDCMSVLPKNWQDELSDNFTWENLAGYLSDYVCILQSELKKSGVDYSNQYHEAPELYE